MESWERDIRSFLKQTNFVIPDFVKAGILINGLQEEPLRRHMVRHTSRLDTYDKLRQEVTEIARAKAMAVNPVPMEVDALRSKGKGKVKTKERIEKSKVTRGRVPTASLPTPRMWSVSAVARRGTRNPIACGARRISRRRSLRADPQCLRELCMRLLTRTAILLLPRSVTKRALLGDLRNQDCAGRGGLCLGAQRGVRAHQALPEGHRAGLWCSGERLSCGLLP